MKRAWGPSCSPGACNQKGRVEQGKPQEALGGPAGCLPTGRVQAVAQLHCVTWPEESQASYAAASAIFPVTSNKHIPTVADVSYCPIRACSMHNARR